MTIEQAWSIPREYLRVLDIAALLESDPQNMRERLELAELGKYPLPFPFIRVGKVFKIPKRPFLNWLTGGSESPAPPGQK